MIVSAYFYENNCNSNGFVSFAQTYRLSGALFSESLAKVFDESGFEKIAENMEGQINLS